MRRWMDASSLAPSRHRRQTKHHEENTRCPSAPPHRRHGRHVCPSAAARGQPRPAAQQGRYVSPSLPPSLPPSPPTPPILSPRHAALTSRSRGRHRARAGEAGLLARAAAHRRVRGGPADDAARQRALLQELRPAQLGRRGRQLQAARRRGAGHQARADRPHGRGPAEPAVAAG